MVLCWISKLGKVWFAGLFIAWLFFAGFLCGGKSDFEIQDLDLAWTLNIGLNVESTDEDYSVGIDLKKCG